MPSHAPAEEWVDAKEVARVTKMHPKTIYRWADTVEGFPSIRIGKRERRFVLSAVMRFIQDHPERMAQASEEYALKRGLQAAKGTPAKEAKAPPKPRKKAKT